MERLPSDRHLDDRAFLSALGDDVPAEAAAHLERCVSCRRELSRFRAAITAHRESLDGVAERAERRLGAERQAIRMRWNAEAGRQRRLRALTWATTATAALLAVAIGHPWWRVERPQEPHAMRETPLATATLASAAASAASDADLLRRAETAVERGTPAALAPVEALLDELGATTSREGGV